MGHLPWFENRTQNTGYRSQKKEVMLMANPNVREIVAEWLKEHGYEGLYSPDYCACENADLMPCDEPCESCRAGYKRPCPGEDCPMGGGCDFHIGETRKGE